MESEGSNDSYRKGKIDICGWRCCQIVGLIIKGKNVLSTKARGYLCII
jgi:hypothetical protein